MEEQWKPVKGYEGLYEVSNTGKVRSLHYSCSDKVKEMVLCKTTNGYMNVNLCKNKKKKSFMVHRLVAEAFVPNPNGYPFVNHKDEQKKNNVASNLEWCTSEYNANYGTRNERSAKARINNPKRSKIVEQYDLNGNLVDVFPSVAEIARKFGYSQGNISMCCGGKHNIAYGYTWKYKESV